ncbi:MAG: hypothetical protein WCF56_23660 [Pseudolabrys sp.]
MSLMRPTSCDDRKQRKQRPAESMMAGEKKTNYLKQSPGGSEKTKGEEN